VLGVDIWAKEGRSKLLIELRKSHDG